MDEPWFDRVFAWWTQWGVKSGPETDSLVGLALTEFFAGLREIRAWNEALALAIRVTDEVADESWAACRYLESGDVAEALREHGR
jgi:hypothetical protein